MMFDKIFRGYRVVSKSPVLSLKSGLAEEINIGFYTDYMSTKTQFRNVGESITLQWTEDGATKMILPEAGVSENSMQLKGFLDWYGRFSSPTVEKVIERLAGYGFMDITEDEALKSDLQKLLATYSQDKYESLSASEAEMIDEIVKYNDGNLKLSQLKHYFSDKTNIFSELRNRI